MRNSDQDAVRQWFRRLECDFRGYLIKLTPNYKGRYEFIVEDPEANYGEREKGRYDDLDKCFPRIDALIRNKRKFKSFKALLLDQEFVGAGHTYTSANHVHVVTIKAITPRGKVRYLKNGDDKVYELSDYMIDRKLFANTPDNLKALKYIAEKANYLAGKKRHLETKIKGLAPFENPIKKGEKTNGK